MLWQQASRMQSSPDQFLTRINAYAFATAEENASGGVIVTAPTCGSAGVMPALVYALRHEMFIGDRAIREAFLASAAVGFIAKHNASIAGAEVGCQGEIGVEMCIRDSCSTCSKWGPDRPVPTPSAP